MGPRRDVSEACIFRSAKVLINRHGGSAAYYASARADDMLDRGQVEGTAVWRRIVKAIDALLALDPTGAIN